MDEIHNELEPHLLPQQPQKGKIRALIARLGLGAFTISLIAHVIFAIIAIFFLYKWVYPPEKELEFVPSGSGGNGNHGETSHKIQQQLQKRMTSNTAVSKRIASTSNSAAFSLPDSSDQLMDPGLPLDASSADAGSGGKSGGGHGTGTGAGFGGGNGPGAGLGAGQLGIGALIPALMKGRCTDSERHRMVQEAGGTSAVETAVTKSLTYLKGTQNANGSWGKDFQTGVTGLVLLSYLGHCEGVQSVEYGDTVSKAITFLIGMGQKNQGRLSALVPGAQFSPWVYEHAIGTYALAEALTFSRTLQFKIPELESTVEKATDMIIKGQNKEGGWDYNFVDVGRNDLSVAGWQLQALKAAHASQVKIDNYDSTITKAIKCISKDCYVKDGKFEYDAKRPHPAMTAIACLCLQQHDKGESLPAKAGIKLIMNGLASRDGKHPASDFSVTYDMKYNSPTTSIYGNYYATQVMRNAGGKEWEAMNRAILEDIVPVQKSDGSFPVGGGSDTNSASGASSSKDVYNQALNTLMLEVYYRFLPTSSHGSSSFGLDSLR